MAANYAGDIPVSGDIIIPESDVFSGADEEMRLLDDVVRSFPPEPLNHLLSSRVCSSCILRLFGKYGPSYCSLSRVLNLLKAVSGDQPNCAENSTRESGDEDCVCSVCYGILQFIHVDEKQVLVKKDCAYDLAVLIFELARRDGHQADGFSLEVSIPPFIVENENAVRVLNLVQALFVFG